MQKILEQQHQHNVNAQHAGQHRQAKAGKELAHDFGVTDFNHLHARRQVLHAGQGQRDFGHITELQARELHLEVDVAGPVIAANHGRSAGNFQLGDLTQHDGADAGFGAGHVQAFQHAQVLARRAVKPHHNRHLALRQVQLGQRHVKVAERGNAQRVGNGRAGNAQIGGAGKVGPHCDLGADQTGAGSHTAQADDGAQVFFNRQRRRLQQFRVFPGQHQNVLLARGSQAHLDAHTGQRLHGAANLLFDGLFHRAFTARAELDRQRGHARFAGTGRGKRVAAGTATTHRGVNALDLGNLERELARLLRQFHRLRQCCARWQLQVNLGLRVVIGGYEALGQQRHQRHRSGKKDNGRQQGQRPVPQTPGGGAVVQGEPARLVVSSDDGAQEVGGHHGCQHARHHQRGKHR